MSYLRKIEFNIEPEGSFKIIRNCAGCGCKTTFINTNNFRVNANGNRIDVWLIYQCEKCRHTYNLSIYDRNKAQSLDDKEYKALMNNSRSLADKYGRDTVLFSRNKAEIDWKQMKYSIAGIPGYKAKKGDFIVINNKDRLKIRYDKILSEILKVTRSKIKMFEKEDAINVTEKKTEHKIEVEICKDI